MQNDNCLKCAGWGHFGFGQLNISWPSHASVFVRFVFCKKISVKKLYFCTNLDKFNLNILLEENLVEDLVAENDISHLRRLGQQLRLWWHWNFGSLPQYHISTPQAYMQPYNHHKTISETRVSQSDFFMFSIVFYFPFTLCLLSDKLLSGLPARGFSPIRFY